MPPVPSGPAPQQPPMPPGQWFRGDPPSDPHEGAATMPIPAADTSGLPPPPSRVVPAQLDDPPGTQWADTDRPKTGGWAWRPRTIGPIWQVVAALMVVAGIVGVVVGFVSGGGDNGGDTNADAPATQPRDQAAALDRLLSGSSDDRQVVVGAVVSLKECRNLAESAATLRDAAASREALVAKLDTVTMSKVPGGQQLKSTLRTAWQSSADADRAFARWGDQIAATGCPDGQPKKTPAYERGTTSSAVASRAKKSFVAQWNKVASRYSLEPRKPSEI